MIRDALVATGVTGYLGSHFVWRMLRSADVPLTAIARPSSQATAAERVRAGLHCARASLADDDANVADVQTVDGDVRVPGCGVRDDALRRLRSAGVAEFWHFAADLRYEDAHRRHIWQTNVDGTAHALQLAHAVGARRFVYVSTAYTAGVAGGSIAEELHPPDGPFNNAYEASKCAAEHLLADRSRELGLALTIVRPSIVIGPRTTKRADGTTSGLYGLIRAAVALQPLMNRSPAPVRVPATADAHMNFIPVDAVMDDIASLREAGFGTQDIYHLTARTGVTVTDSLEAVAAVTGLRNVELRVPGSFQPNALERRIARRVEFYLGYLNADKRFERSLGPHHDVDRAELTAYITAACRDAQYA